MTKLYIVLVDDGAFYPKTKGHFLQAAEQGYVLNTSAVNSSGEQNSSIASFSTLQTELAEVRKE